MNDHVEEITDDIDIVREYWDRQPCNSNHSGADFGSRTYFNEIEKRRYFVHPHIYKFADFENWKSKRVLEIGCGIGTDAVNFARHGSIYTGVDLSPETLAIAQQRMAIFDLEGVFHSHNAEQLDELLPAASFDLIYSIGVIHHTVCPRAIIAAARRVIKTDGEFRMMVYAKHSWKAAMIESGLDQPESQNGCPIASTYNQDDLQELLSGHFEIIDMHRDHIFPYQVEPYKNFVYQREAWFQAMPDEMFAALEATMGWHWLIRAKPI